ncbi:hypothetical protein NPX13_g8066 [Xylaria arbuscula]|uniref:Uncharacterized protein n=1 Tax=Xylaria arbuscula TaxID=114810 RepID=A0A9W8N8W0_9PEZI|nr:hypothetical protein NPX13_g8066 [Xylaria arbuscula]
MVRDFEACYAPCLNRPPPGPVDKYMGLSCRWSRDFSWDKLTDSSPKEELKEFEAAANRIIWEIRDCVFDQETRGRQEEEATAGDYEAYMQMQLRIGVVRDKACVYISTHEQNEERRALEIRQAEEAQQEREELAAQQAEKARQEAEVKKEVEVKEEEEEWRWQQHGPQTYRWQYRRQSNE